MELVLRRSFKNIHCHTIGHTRGAFWGGKYYHCDRNHPSWQNSEGWED